MIFTIHELTFAVGSFELEGWAAFAARCVCGLLILLAGWLVRRWLMNHAFPKLQARRRKGPAVPILLRGFAAPLGRLALLTGLYLALVTLPWRVAAIPAFFLKIYRIGVIACLCLGFYSASDLTALLLKSFSPEIRGSATLQSVLVKIYKLMVLILGGLMIAQESGLPVSGLLTSAGLVGLTISLAAQDSASNLFSGMVILLERPFHIGDWIIVEDVEGKVEDINFRSTKIRALDNSLYILTNSKVCSSVINNCAERQKRLYRFTLGVTYDTTRPQLEKLMADLTDMLKGCPDLYEDSVIVRLTGFGASSIDLLVSAYARTAEVEEFLRIQNSLNLSLMDVMKKNGVDFAFPSTSVYIEKMPAK